MGRETKKRKRKHKRRYKRGTKKWKSKQCALSLKKNKGETCYSTESLHKLRDLWNARHSDCKIKTSDPREIWKNLKYYMRNTCNTESCWLRQKFSKNKLTKELNDFTFAPKAPPEWKKKPTEWLSSLDFVKIMKQYENKYKCFLFIGPSPIDYDKHLEHGECVWEELCKFDLEKVINKGKTQIGVIFNTDPHDKDGAHWVALYINIKRKEIYYFDSYGDRISKFINRFAKNKIIKQGAALGMAFKFIKNKKRHQYRASECGMYCLYFIIQMLTTTQPFEEFSKNKIEDKKMIRLRKILFNH